MANTIIQIKRSTGTTIPADGSLSAAEPAYSYLSEKLFIGDSLGTGVIEIGGKYWIDQTTRAFDQANAAYQAANVGNNKIVFDQANVAYDQANAAYNMANTANLFAYNVSIGANAYADAVGAGSNAFAVYMGTSSNLYAQSVGNAANSYADSTFVKLIADSQTITGNLAVTGSLTVSGNAFSIDTETLRVSDPLIYLAGNNYSSDIVDIGFVANYNNGSANLHTGLFRDATVKEYYLFHEYNEEPYPNHININGNNFTLAVLNADIKTSNLVLGGANAILTIGAAFNKANAANVLAYNTGISSNAYALELSIAANNWANTISEIRSVASNAWANSVGSAAGAAANSYADLVGTAANTNAANGSYISSGIVKVTYGGTGKTTFIQNGILFGNTAGDLKVTNAGTEGQVLQASATGVPQFGMIDGGAF